jgi:EmrB/QacA subfamily drug resistance transporter
MSTLDSSIVNIALPTISRELHITANQATWTVSIYLIAVSALLIFFGSLGDMIGKIRVFKVGTFIFTLGSLLAGFNLGIWFLLFARFVQAIGAAMTMSNSFGITTSTFPVHQRARAMSMIGIFVSLGAVAGPGVGGMILEVLPWSYIFWVNVPIGIIAILLGQKLFPKEPKVTTKPTLDILGTALFFLTIALLFLGIEVGQNIGFTKPIVLILVAISIVLLIVFIRVELHREKPLINLNIFNNQLFSISLISALLIFITNFFASIIMPFYLQNFLGWSPGRAGLMMMAFPITMMIMGPIGGYFGDHYNKELITAFGILLVVVSQLGYTLFTHESSIALIAGVTIVNSVGTGLFQSSNNALVMGSVDKKFLGVAGSVNALARNLGMITGITIATVTLWGEISKKVGYHVTTYVASAPDAFIYAMHIAFYVSFVLGLITFILTMYRLISKKKNGKEKVEA